MTYQNHHTGDPTSARKPYIMVSNDDGIDAKGLRSLIEFLAPMAEIVAVAPDGPRSGQSSAITVDAPLRIKRRPDFCGAKMYAVNGTPVDCIKLGLHAVAERRPDLLIAGINHGSNAGNCVIYSGTMGAVIEGATVGITSVGFSLLHHSHDADFSQCGATVVNVVEALLGNPLPDGVCLNVNIPAMCTPRGLKVVRAARGYWTEEYVRYVDPSGNPYWWLTGKFNNIEPNDPTTDEYWLGRQWSTAVPVSIDQTAADAIDPLSGLGFEAAL